MKKIYLSIRIAAILSLGLVATVGIFGEPNEEQPFGSWLFDMVVSKSIGFAAVAGIAYLVCGSECIKTFLKGIMNNDDEPEHENNSH